jgi:hypothetical protein
MNPGKLIVAALLLALFGVAPSARATWYGENVEKGSDIMMMDVRWPWWPESTYFANWNFTNMPSGIGGYGGFAMGGVLTLEPDHRPNFDPEYQGALRPGSVWSFWGANQEGEPVRVEASSEFTYPRQYIGEGASGALAGPVWPFIRQNRWFTMMMRVWQPLGVENPQHSYIGRWVKDVEAGQWHLYGIMKLPVPATAFNGNAGFLEDYHNKGRSVRSLHRRLGYARKDGQWLKTDTVTYTVKPLTGRDNYWIANILPEGDHEYLAMELSSNPALLPQKLQAKPLEPGKKHPFTVKQPDQPALDRPEVKNVAAESNGRQVAVCWEIPDTAAPQFGYKIEVFDNSENRGQPLAVREERMPTVRNVLIDAATTSPTVRLTVTDVFDQTAAPVVMQAARSEMPATAATPVTTAPGLEYEFLVKEESWHVNVFHPPGDKTEASRKEQHFWLSLAELKDGKQVQSGIARGFDTSPAEERKGGYAFRFKGLLRAPASGLYLLHMKGSDGYRIALNGRPVLLWDGPHGPAQRTATVNLAQGDHPLAVDYFVDNPPVPYFKFEWEGPGVPRQEVPQSALVHEETGRFPQAILTSSGGTDGTATIKVTVDPRGHAIAKTRLFLGKLQIAEADGPGITCTGPMPGGESPVWVRLFYDKDHALDSESLALRVMGPDVRDWNVSVAGETKLRRGLWQTAPDAFSFVGEGEYIVSRRIKGDFTLTCRVDSYAGAKDEPVNGSSWVGLTVREDASKNRKWGREFGIMQTARNGLRATPNHSDLGASRMSDYPLPKNRPWLRVIRQGNLWMAWTSADGVAWEHGATYFIKASEEMDAGLVFRALPQGAQAYFQARVSNLKLEPGIAKDIAMPVPVPAQGTDGARLTGVVLAHADSSVVVVRSSSMGLLRSTDGGQTWTPANGGLIGVANIVRSVAIHPKDSRIMLRAAGHAGSDGIFVGGLWLTKDGGQGWEKLAFPGDFDGEGPSALCGEVVGFDSVHPDVLWAGTETRGFFRSEDGGKTWKQTGAREERITAISVNRVVRGNEDQAYLHIATCPDAWLPLLGRGNPKLSAKATLARAYVSHNGGRSLSRTCERSDLGYLNLAFDLGAARELPYGTTHGILKAMSDGQMTFLVNPAARNVEWMRPVTALGAAGTGERQPVRFLTQPLNPAKPGRLSIGKNHSWSWADFRGDKPKGGLIAVAGEFKQGKLWWLLATDGLYHSKDGGTTLTKIRSAGGEPEK